MKYERKYLKSLKIGDVIKLLDGSNSNFTFLGYDENYNHSTKRYTRVKCSCGTNNTFIMKYIRNGDVKYCDNCRSDKRKKPKFKKRNPIKYHFSTGDRIITRANIPTKFTFIEYIVNENSKRKVKVKCDCGREKIVTLSNMLSGKSICCGFSPCKIPKNKGNRSIKTNINHLFYSYKQGAKNRNYSFSLSKEEFIHLITQRCYYCNVEPSNKHEIKNSKTNELRAGISMFYNGIDRIINSKGYDKDNVVTCCAVCNKMKMTLDKDDFLNNILRIVNNLKL